MRITYPILLSLLLTSCAAYKSVDPMHSPPSTVREPSSSDDETNLATAFDMMMNSSNPEKEFVDYLTRQKSIFVRAEANLADFDHELDDSVAAQKNFAFDDSKTYKKLIVMWGLSHRLQDKIIYHYVKLTDMAYDKSLPASKRKMAKNILHKFKAKLDSKDPMEKISFDELKTEIAQAIKERQGMTNKSLNPADVPEVNFKDEQEKLKTLRAYRDQLRNLGKIEQDSDNDLTQKIERDSEKLKIVDAAGREPQSELRFKPSVGPDGNVMGLVFPKNVWALTYDDGPNPTHTTAILNNLQTLGIKATFFWLAENVLRYQSVVDLVKERGMPRENHSWTHPQLPKLDDAGLQKEIVQSTAVDTKAYGEKPRFFRCPYGAGNSVPKIRGMIADLGMIHVFWNVDTLDWQDKDPDSIVERAKKQMAAAGHGVILFHDIHPQSVIASRKLVEWSQTQKDANAIRWVTIPEIVDEMNGVTPPPPVEPKPVDPATASTKVNGAVK
ncbi:MAG: polysaccharide deacetylase family protein [Rhizobacter sp.]|nr:polysaccharide deacetylase family protein [Bacteriovorax sp.]